MTENESLEFLKERIELINSDYPDVVDYKNALECAIRALEEIQQYRKHGVTVESALNNMCDLAAADNLIEEYRAIGTPELCRMAVGKQTARRSLHQGCYDKDGVWHEWNGIDGKPYELCPSCGVNLCCKMPINKKPNYCKECGQKLDWNRRANDGETD